MTTAQHPTHRLSALAAHATLVASAVPAVLALTLLVLAVVGVGAGAAHATSLVGHTADTELSAVAAPARPSRVTRAAQGDAAHLRPRTYSPHLALFASHDPLRMGEYGEGLVKKLLNPSDLVLDSLKARLNEQIALSQFLADPLAAVPALADQALAVVDAAANAVILIEDAADGHPSAQGDVAADVTIVALEVVVGAVLERVVGGAVRGGAAGGTPQMGRKLDYFLGRATGSSHNIARSNQMLSQLERIGLRDTAATRQYLTEHLTEVLNTPSNIARVQDNGRVVRESVLMGPGGGVKFETVWEGERLITGNIFGGP